MVVVGRLRQRREVGRLLDGEILQLLVEIAHARGRAAIGAHAEVDLVEIELENAVLRVGALDADGEDRFLDLALHRALAAQKKVLRHLLGDGRGAFDAPRLAFELRFDELEDGARDALEIDAAVFVEAPVLGRKERRDEALGDRVDRHEDAPLARVLGDERAVVRVDARHHRRLVLREALVAGEVLRDLPQQEAGGRREAEEPNDKRRKSKAEEAQEKASTPPALARGRLLRMVGGVHQPLFR